MLDQLVANGQVATQYVDLEGEPTMDQRYNPNGSLPVSYTHLHAIIKALKKSPDCGEIWCAPGNGGISYDAKCKNIKATDVELSLIHILSDSSS